MLAWLDITHLTVVHVFFLSVVLLKDVHQVILKLTQILLFFQALNILYVQRVATYIAAIL